MAGADLEQNLGRAQCDKGANNWSNSQICYKSEVRRKNSMRGHLKNLGVRAGVPLLLLDLPVAVIPLKTS